MKYFLEDKVLGYEEDKIPAGTNGLLLETPTQTLTESGGRKGSQSRTF
jgi:hypothetical protein